MVECRDGVSSRLPDGIVMARITAGGERAMVRVFVTIGALGEGDAGVAYDLCGGIGRVQRGVAFGTLHLDVGAGKFVFGRGMVESRDVFPFGGRVGYRMTTLAFVAQLTLVPVFVARHAGCAQSKKAAAKVLHEDDFAGGGRNPLGVVTAVALETGVAAFQRITRLAMIELVDTDIPADGRSEEHTSELQSLRHLV